MLRYPGGKTRACEKLDRIMQEEKMQITANVVNSVFYGGGSFELFLRDKYNCAIRANDAFKPLISFWSALQSQPLALKQAVAELKPLSKERFTSLQQTVMAETGITQGAQFYALNRSSFSGAVLCGGYSRQAEAKRFTQSSIVRIQEFDSSNITYSNLDFVDFINSIPDGEFMFLDPPYLIESKLYGNKGDLHQNFNHNLLAEMLNSRHNWMLCYNNSDAVLSMYQDTNIIGYELDWSYGMNKTKKSSEVVLCKNDSLRL